MKFDFVFSTLALAASALAVKDNQDTTTLTASLSSTTSISVPSGCSYSKAFTATAQSDLDTLAGCQAIKGDVVITGELGSANIANVKVIYGDLQVYDTQTLEALTADSVTTITGALKLHNVTLLSTLSFASLSSIGAINWVTLPNLGETGLHEVNECNSILVSDTNLTALDGLNPTDVEVFNVNNNKQLVSISSSIETISNALTVAFNGNDTTVEFEDLIWANNMTFYSVSSIYIPEIVAINKSAGFFESSVEELDFSLVTSIGGDLTIENNEQLSYIDFGNVTSIGGGLVIVNNTELVSIDNLDSIKSIQGAAIIKGDFDNCTMHSLKTVKGSFDLETTGYADCQPFKKLSKNGGIKGDYTCKAKTKKSSSSSKTSKSSKSSTKTKSSSKTTSGSDDSASGNKNISSSSSSSSSAEVSSISSTSKGDASFLKCSSVFSTMAAIFFSLL
ncbi:hypothetical protein PMKS-001737 [Pichia membranifaciens]|uniref:Receptor L-domain domain-containing protein n=1 Tax=Pichia membranifaciens TaxID=4926 RepID=A0A1Q2YFD8_9ASCO|nr:hypothetical protein PMKS-001737 [Pichia membranifaciens]